MKDGEPGFKGIDYRESKNKKPGPSKKVGNEKTLFREKVFGEGPQAMIKKLVWGLRKKIHLEVLREPNKKLTVAKSMEFISSSQSEILEKRIEKEKAVELTKKHEGFIAPANGFSQEAVTVARRRQESVRPSGQPFKLMNLYDVQSDDEDKEEIDLKDERS